MMMYWRQSLFGRLSTFFIATLAIAGVGIGTEAEVLVPRGAEWRFFVGLTEASNPVDAWRQSGFNDQSWALGPAPVGYGEPDILTVIPSSAAGNWLSVYFRRSFTVANPAGVRELDFTIRIDDGFVAWINGVEIGR